MKKMNLLETLKLKRSLNKREKILIAVLVLVIVFLLVFRFVIRPQHKKLQEITEEKIEYEEKSSYMRSILEKENEVYNEWDNLYNKRALIMRKHFSHIDQPQIIYMLNELLDNDDLEILDIKFERPYDEEIEESTVQVMDIAIPYRSTYDDFLDTIRKISVNEKRFLISELIMDQDDEFVVGDLNLKVYGLEGIDGIDKQASDVEIVLNGGKSSPFEMFDSYIDIKNQNYNDDSNDNKNYDYSSSSNNISNDSGSINKYSDKYNDQYNNKDKDDKKNDSKDKVEKKDDKNNNKDKDDKKDDLIGQEEKYEKKVLEDFENISSHFDSYNNFISKSINKKSGKYSLRLEYNIPDSKDKNKILLDLKDRNITMKAAPYTMGIWVYSYNYSPITLGFQFKGQVDEKLELDLCKRIFWKGWKYLEIVPPQDRTLYPLQLENIYLESAHNSQERGVLLFDKLEANYSKENKETGGYFDFYIVKKDDTLDKISIKAYKTKNKKNIIMEYNEIKNENEIKEGRILVIPR